MDHLSSCYFCGTALDEQLQEYAVVPPAFRDAERDVTTATLCPTCQQKLERVLDAVVAAAEGAESAGTDATSGGDEGTAEAEPGDDSDEGTTGAGARDVLVDPDEAIDSPDEDDITAADVTAMAGDIDAGVGGDDGDETDGDEDDAADEIATEDGEARAGDVDADGLDEGDDDEELQEAMNPDVPEEFQSGGETADEAVEGTPVVEEGADDATDTDGQVAGEDATDTDEQVAGDDADADAPASDEGAGDATPSAQASISALEYNKVMRLLQNREFPVDRAEIETVAANAYDLSRSECAAVIDLAVDRGLIAETDGQLARPE